MKKVATKLPLFRRYVQETDSYSPVSSILTWGHISSRLQGSKPRENGRLPPFPKGIGKFFLQWRLMFQLVLFSEASARVRGKILLLPPSTLLVQQPWCVFQITIIPLIWTQGMIKAEKKPHVKSFKWKLWKSLALLWLLICLVLQQKWTFYI